MNASQPTSAPWPRCGASAAIFRGNQILLIERGKGSYRGHWSLPGGHVEPGETASAAAKREVAEETGITAEIAGLLDVHDIIMRRDDGALAAHYMIAVFFGRHVSGEPIPGDDAAAARFVALSDLASMPLTPRAEDFIRRAAAQRGNERR